MKNLDDILQDATERIDARYFQLPIAGEGDPIYRERVYCYELYHQMRSLWPKGCRYSLNGEIDKSGHPLIRENGLDRLKPDLLVHVPGEMDNYAIIEVKPVTGAFDGFKKDLGTLAAFREHAGYQRSILLIYGAGGMTRIRPKVSSYMLEHSKDCEIWFHTEAGKPAYPYKPSESASEES